MALRTLLVVFATVLGASSALAQAPAPVNTISADATDTLRVAPDVARITLIVVTKDPVAETATDENEKLAKDLVDNIAKLKINGIKVTSQVLKIAKVETSDNVAAVPGANPVTKSDYRAARAVTISVKDANPEQLQATVAKIQKEAAKMGVAGDSNQSIYNGFGNERQNAVKVTYGLQDGWDDRSKEVLAKLTKRALDRAKLLAEGAGLKVVGVVSIDEPREPTTPSTLLNIYGNQESNDELTDGELVLKVRIRVTVRVMEK